MAKSNHSKKRLIDPLVLGDRSLSIEDLVSVARGFRPVTLGAEAKARVELSRAVVEEILIHDAKVYGITTGFASLRDQRIDASDAGQLSTNLIKSHATGVGAPFDEDVVRGAMLVRAQTLARGCSGVRVDLIQVLLDMLNAHVYPFVPQQGSVGSSGDLAPLSHLFLVAIGEPDAMVYHRESNTDEDSYVTSSRETDFIELSELGDKTLPFSPITLQAKEGLGSNNGAVFSAVVTALAAFDSENLLAVEELVSALSFEALQAVPDCLQPTLAQTRPHPGHLESAKNIRSALTDSQLVPGDKPASLNMAHYNCAMMKLHRLGKDIPQLTDLHKQMESAQPGISASHSDTESCETLLQPIVENWRTALGWSEQSNCAQSLPVATIEALAQIYSQHIRAILRPLGDPDLQDNYSFRATPTVLGSARQALEHTLETITTEINSVTDNPIILLDTILESYHADTKDGSYHESPTLGNFKKWLSDNWQVAIAQVKSAANFHGEPIGIAADYLAIAMAEAGNISERRLAVLLDSDHSKGLPSYLIWQAGLNSGLMLTQYTAASIVTENKTLATPASVDSIPTGESCEDHNSMSTLASRKLAQIVKNVKTIVALEALAAYQAVQFRKPMTLGDSTGKLESLVAGKIHDTMLKQSEFADVKAMREFLIGIGLAKSTAESIQPCLVRDISMRPLLRDFLKLIDSKEIITLANANKNTPLKNI